MICCSGFCATTAAHFNERIASRDLARYRRKGPPVTTRMLRDCLRETGLITGTLLDIGTGIGALTLELLKIGVEQAVAIDASEAYIAAAREEAERRGLGEAVEWRYGDFVSCASEFQKATVVTLDRVVCCYPTYEPLIREAASRATQWFALSYPKDRWYVRAFMGFDNTKRRLRSNPFRTFVHPANRIEELIRANGFRLVRRADTVVWRVETYVRAESNIPVF